MLNTLLCLLSQQLALYAWNSGCDYACVPNVRCGAVAWGTPLQDWRSRVDFPWYHWDVPLPSFFQQRHETGVDSAPNRNEYQRYLLGSKGGRCVRLTALPTSLALSRNSGRLGVLEPEMSVHAYIGIAVLCSSFLVWKRGPPDMEFSCEYAEKAVEGVDKHWSSVVGHWTSSTIRNIPWKTENYLRGYKILLLKWNRKLGSVL